MPFEEELSNPPVEARAERTSTAVTEALGLHHLNPSLRVDASGFELSLPGGRQISARALTEGNATTIAVRSGDTNHQVCFDSSGRLLRFSRFHGNQTMELALRDGQYHLSCNGNP